MNGWSDEVQKRRMNKAEGRVSVFLGRAGQGRAVQAEQEQSKSGQVASLAEIERWGVDVWRSRGRRIDSREGEVCRGKDGQRPQMGRMKKKRCEEEEEEEEEKKKEGGNRKRRKERKERSG